MSVVIVIIIILWKSRSKVHTHLHAHTPYTYTHTHTRQDGQLLYTYKRWEAIDGLSWLAGFSLNARHSARGQQVLDRAGFKWWGRVSAGVRIRSMTQTQSRWDEMKWIILNRQIIKNTYWVQLTHTHTHKYTATLTEEARVSLLVVVVKERHWCTEGSSIACMHASRQYHTHTQTCNHSLGTAMENWGWGWAPQMAYS